MKNILVATDGSKGGQKAVDVAVDLAKAENAKLTIINVVDTIPLSGELAEFGEVEFGGELTRVGADAEPVPVAALEGLALPEAVRVLEVRSAPLRRVVSDSILSNASASAGKAGVAKTDTVSAVGDVANEIIAAAKRTGAELIVVGRRGRGQLTEMLLGSVSQKVLHRAHVNVLTVA